eukprot:gnl/TRDRNA2_/TRDRNA2_188715_c0_seq1.p1 gnl/TRDRNA2_/TRDRNA2_188715_c0~~gnl/TRDRNA2_/TRDRNA2_188715_c0_seq1.p1  ORF type:complete len:448 (-),score=93.55 gnl/TRDRNA2_/TRDRNA2_188715_c0_seq1:146-1396(-)
MAHLRASVAAPSHDACRAPAPKVPPKGLIGLLEGYNADAILDTSDFPPNMVMLNVYNLADSETIAKINKVTTANNSVLVGGVFHAGVEVYGREWCYGGTEDDSSGVRAHYPRAHPQHTYRTTVPMGCTWLNEQEADKLLLQLMDEWKGNYYHVLRCNCLSFCNDALIRLGLRRMPGWVDRAQRMAVALEDGTQKVKSFTAEAPSHASDALERLKTESTKFGQWFSEWVNTPASVRDAGQDGGYMDSQGRWVSRPGGSHPALWANSDATEAVTTQQQAASEASESQEGTSWMQWGEQLQKKGVWGGLFGESAEEPRPQEDDEREELGIIRAQEETVLKQGLLDWDDDDDDPFPLDGSNGVGKIENDWEPQWQQAKLESAAPDKAVVPFTTLLPGDDIKELVTKDPPKAHAAGLPDGL